MEQDDPHDDAGDQDQEPVQGLAVGREDRGEHAARRVVAVCPADPQDLRNHGDVGGGPIDEHRDKNRDPKADGIPQKAPEGALYGPPDPLSRHPAPEPERKDERCLGEVCKSGSNTKPKADAGKHVPVFSLRDAGDPAEQEQAPEGEKQVGQVVVEDDTGAPAQGDREELPQKDHPARDHPL